MQEVAIAAQSPSAPALRSRKTDSLTARKAALDERSYVLATYALCGFANIGSIAIQVGGLGSLAPERRPDLARLGLRAMIGGLLACYMTACVAGVLL